MLGCARYRLGDWEASVQALDKSRALHKNPEAAGRWTWLYLAMAYAQLGQSDQAHRWYELAVRHRASHPVPARDLEHLYREAEGVLNKVRAGAE